MASPVLIPKILRRDRWQALSATPDLLPASGVAAPSRPTTAFPVRTWRRRLLVSALFLTLIVVNSYPLAFRLDSAIGGHFDSYFSTWRLAWVAHQIVADPLHLFDGNIFYPERTTLAYSDAMLLPALVVAPLHWIGVSALAVYNLTLIAAFFLSALAAYCLVRSLTGSTTAGLLGGIVFAFSPHRLQHFHHLELQFAFWIPWAVLAWHRAVGQQARAGYLRVAALATGQVLSCIYFGVFLITWLAFVTAVWFFRRPLLALKAGVVMLAPPLLALAIYSLPYLEARETVGERPRSEVSFYSATPVNFLSAPESNRLYGWTESLGENEQRLFPGIAAFVLVVVALWPPVDRIRALHAAGLALSIVLALGFNGYLYQVLYDWVLPFRGLRVPARAAILILLGTAVLAGCGLTRVMAAVRRRRTAAALAAAIIAIASVEYLSSPRIVPVPPPSPWYAWLGTLPDAIVFEWPVGDTSLLRPTFDATYMHRSTLHWRPLVNGYSGKYPRSFFDLLRRMRSFPDESSLRYLRRRGVSVLVLHERPDSTPSYAEAVDRLLANPDIEPIVHDHEGNARIAFFRFRPVRDASR